jgi:very-short-patch-repair endonuclease
MIIEVDGGQHAEDANYDSVRDGWLRERGFVVLRFWNHEVLKNIDGITEVIAKNLQSTPFLNPSPQGGRRKSAGRKRGLGVSV